MNTDPNLKPRFTLCASVHQTPEDLTPWLRSLLDRAPEQHELRIAFSTTVDVFHRVLGSLLPDSASLACACLSPGVERVRFLTQGGLRVILWHAKGSMPDVALRRLLYHDVRLETDYVAMLVPGRPLCDGWLGALCPSLGHQADLIGTAGWHEYTPGELEQIRASPWYMGKAHAQRERRPGVAFMRGGLIGVRTERLRQVQFPDRRWPGAAEVLLGAIAHQLGWSQARHEDTGAAPATNAAGTGQAAEVAAIA